MVFALLGVIRGYRTAAKQDELFLSLMAPSPVYEIEYRSGGGALPSTDNCPNELVEKSSQAEELGQLQRPLGSNGGYSVAHASEPARHASSGVGIPA